MSSNFTCSIYLLGHNPNPHKQIIKCQPATDKPFSLYLIQMGRYKLLKFGLGAPELFYSEPVYHNSKGDGFQNSLRNIACNKGLAYLVSPQIGAFWRTLVLLNTNTLKESQWQAYSNLKNQSFRALLNLDIIDRSTQEVQGWEESVGYPGLKLLMLRAEKIKIKYQTERKFDQKLAQAKGFEAVVIQQAYDTLEALDPLMAARGVDIIDERLKSEHMDRISFLFSEFIRQREKGCFEDNPFHRNKPFNLLRREIAYCISDKYSY